MKAYTVNRFWLCQMTGEVMAQISFSIGEIEKAYEKFFPSVDFANTYIAKEKREWFLAAIEKYVNHKKQIIDNSQVPEEKQKALAICLEAYKVYCDKSLETIVAGFLKGKKHFELILPHNSNPSFESSQNNLNELIKFCESENILQKK